MFKSKNIFSLLLISSLCAANLVAMDFLRAARAATEIFFDQEEKVPNEEEIEDDSLLTQSQSSPTDLTKNYEGYEEVPLEQPLDETDNLIAQSVILGCYDGVTKALEAAQVQASNDKSQPLIAHIIELNNPLMLNGLIIDGFKKNAFTSFDLKWVIEHFSSLNENEKKEVNTPFLLMMNTKSPGKRAQALLELITNVNIEKSVTVDRNGFLNTSINLFAYYASPFVKSHSTGEHWNVLVETLEKGYIDALNVILDEFPDLVGQLDTTISVIRKEYISDKDEEISYTFIEWLMRNKNGTKNAYINRNALANQKYFYYPQIAALIAKRMITDDKISISDISFTMISLLHQQQDLNDEEFNLALQKIKKS